MLIRSQNKTKHGVCVRITNFDLFMTVVYFNSMIQIAKKNEILFALDIITQRLWTGTRSVFHQLKSVSNLNSASVLALKKEKIEEADKQNGNNTVFDRSEHACTSVNKKKMERFFEKEDVVDKFTREKMNENFYKLTKMIAFGASPKYVLLSCKANLSPLLLLKFEKLSGFTWKIIQGSHICVSSFFLSNCIEINIRKMKFRKH